MTVFGAVQIDWGPCQGRSVRTLARLRGNEYGVFQHQAEGGMRYTSIRVGISPLLIGRVAFDVTWPHFLHF